MLFLRDQTCLFHCIIFAQHFGQSHVLHNYVCCFFPGKSAALDDFKTPFLYVFKLLVMGGESVFKN